MNILGVAPLFPTQYRPESGVFVYSLFTELRRQGNRVEVIAPLPWAQRLVDPWTRQKSDISWIFCDSLARPSFQNLPLHVAPNSKWAYQKTLQSFQHAIHAEIKAIGGGVEWVYAHFLMSGLACIDVCQEMRLPCIVGLGESNLEGIVNNIGVSIFVQALRRFTGVVAVSREIECFCRERCPELGERLIYIPNGVDVSRFRPRNRDSIRAELGLPLQKQIVLFCGHFIERKGPLRVREALEFSSNAYGVFLGQGKQVPQGSRVLYAGPVTHDHAPLWFAAADVFVLPSLAEGMSNAILEALASGLPVVVSDRPFNRDFLTDECAVFVDPNSPKSIANGLEELLFDPQKREKMSVQAVELAQRYSLAARAKKIVEFYHDSNLSTSRV